MTGKRFKGKPCVYCSAPAETGDHVIARSFFPVEFRDSLPQVPACFACNAKKSLLETYLTATLPLGGNHPAASLVVEREIGKRLATNARLQREIEDGFCQLAHISNSMHATVFRGEVLTEYSGWVAAGLLYHEFGALLGGEYVARGTTITDNGVAAFDQMFAAAGPAVTTVVREFAGGALVYRGFSALQDARLSVWQLRLYDGLNLGVAAHGGTALFDLAGITIDAQSPIVTG